MKNLFFVVFVLCTFNISGQTQQDFIHTSGSYLVHGQHNDTILLRGINFNNFWLEDTALNWFFNDSNDLGSPKLYDFGDQN